jgi:hypothetical protein
MSDESSDANPPWLADLRGLLGERTEAIRAALGDIAALCDSSAVGWRASPAPDQNVTIYVVGSGVLYRLTGQREPEINNSNPDAERTSRCEVKPMLIRSDWKFCLDVAWKFRPNQSEKNKIRRTWTFGIGELEPLVIECPQQHTVVDPTPFVRGLAVGIVNASASV